MITQKHILMLSAALGMSLATWAQRGYVKRAIERSYEEKYGEPGAEKGNDWLNNKLLNVKVAPTYTFSKSTTMKLTSYKNGVERDVSEMTYYFTNNSTVIGMESKTISPEKRRKNNDDIFTIYDYKANTMVMLNRSEKTAMAMSLNAFMSKENIEKREKGIPSKAQQDQSKQCKRTGKTKTIKGLLCEEWICIDEERETRSEIWVNTKAGYAMDAQRRGPLTAYLAHNQINGLIMEGLFYKRDVLESKMETIDINNTKPTTISTSGYRIN